MSVSREFIKLASGDPSFVAAWEKRCEESAKEEDIWISGLRRMGIVAAHPDDGWVNREKNEFQLCYPWFDDGCGIGTKVALGNPDQWRVLKVKSFRKTIFGRKIFGF